MGEFYGSIHNHTDNSNYRLRDSTNRLEDLCWYAAKDLNHNFIAITDHETIGTAIECQDIEAKIREQYPDFKVIRGNEIYLCRNGLNAENYKKGEDQFYHFILLAKDEIGHRQLRELSTRAWLRGFKTGKMMRVPTYYNDIIEIIGADPGHVIGSTACLGSKVAQLSLDCATDYSEEKYEYIKNWVINLSNIFGKENFFLEVQPSFNKEQITVNKFYKELSKEINFPVVISLDAHYMKKSDEPIHHAFLTSQEGDRETQDFYASTYMMSTEEIHSYMDDSVGAATVTEWLENTRLIYDMCEDYDLTKPTRIVYLPKTINTITQEEYEEYKDRIKELDYFYHSPYAPNVDLAAAIVTKIKQDKEQYDNQRTYEEIDENLKAIRLASEKMDTRWSAYILNLRDYIRIIWEQGNSLVGCARGCFYPNEMVLLENGMEKPISEINIGDKVMNHNGNINEVKQVYTYDIEEECYIIKGKGREEIHCTNNHQFYIKKCKSCDNPSYKSSWCKETCRRSELCSYEKTHEVGFVPANELEVGDMLAYPKPKLKPLSIEKIDLFDYIDTSKRFYVNDETIGYYIGNNEIKKNVELPRYIKIDKEFAYLCGVFIGDGWTKTEKENELGLCFNSETEKDKASLMRCMEYLSKINLTPTLNFAKDKKLVQMHFYSSILWKFFRTNFGKDTYEKHIPDWLMTSNRDITIGLLEGLMASDGHYQNDRISYTSVHKNLIKQVQMLWASIGIYGNYTIRVYKQANWKDSYTWSASGKQLQKLLNDFPLVTISNKKFTKQDYLEDDDCFYTIIESIKTEKYKGKVYDLNVENIHSYVINGTSVHNSGTGFLLLNMLDVTQINPLRETTKTYSFRFLNPERVSPLD